MSSDTNSSLFHLLPFAKSLFLSCTLALFILGSLYYLNTGFIRIDFTSKKFWIGSACWFMSCYFYYLHQQKPPKKLNWTKEFIWLTGGTHGLGRALVETLYTHSSGQVHILMLDKETPEPSWLLKFQGQVQFVSTDFTALTSHVIQAWITKYGAPTILINNAGTMVGKYLTELSDLELERVLKVNLLAPMLLSKAVLPYMIKRDQGHLVHVSSACGLVGLAWLTDYCASKFGLVGFHEALRQELRNTKVKTSLICPAQIDTRLFQCTKPKFPWLVPMLTPQQVALKVIDVLEESTSKDVWMPWFVHTAILVRSVPIWLNDFGHRIMGANDLHPHETAPY